MAIHLKIRETWLSRKPTADASFITLLTTLLLVVGSLAYWWDFSSAISWMPASKQTVFQNHQYWRAWTTLAVHADEKHLLGNCFLFFILGYFLNGYFGRWVFPLGALFAGGLINLMVLSQMPEQTILMGVSGVVFWMGAVWLVLYLFIERKKSLYQRILRTCGVALVLFMPAEAFDPNISYRSHFIGFATGVVFATFYFLSKKSFFKTAEIQEIVFEDSELESGFELTEESQQIPSSVSRSSSLI